MNFEQIKQDLSHAYWIGGIATGGKTTASKLLSERYAIKNIYHTDDHAMRQFDRAIPEKHPTILQIKNMSFESYISLPDDEWLKIFIDYFNEGFEMIIEDLYSLPNDRPILVEGGELIPELVFKVANPRKAVWMIPSSEFLTSFLPKHSGL